MLDPRASLAELAGLDPTDVDAVALVGASAMASGRFALAVKVFAGLAALEPAVALHHARLGAARHAAGDVDGALAALDAALAADDAAGPLDDANRVHALLLRAEIRAPADREGARADLAAARALAAGSPAAKAALEGGA